MCDTCSDHTCYLSLLVSHCLSINSIVQACRVQWSIFRGQVVSDTLAQCPNINCGSVTLWPDVSSVYSKICFTPNTVVKSKLHRYFTPFLCTVKESAASSYMRVHCLLGEVRERARVMSQEYDIHCRLGLAFCLQAKNSLICIPCEKWTIPSYRNVVISDIEFKSHTSTYMYSATQGDGMWDIGWGWPLIMMPHPHNLINTVLTHPIVPVLWKLITYSTSLSYIRAVKNFKRLATAELRIFWALSVWVVVVSTNVAVSCNELVCNHCLYVPSALCYLRSSHSCFEICVCGPSKIQALTCYLLFHPLGWNIWCSWSCSFPNDS